MLVAIIISTMPIITSSFTEARYIENNHSGLEPYSENESAEEQENRIAIIDTSYGIITIELFERRASVTTANFINLSIDGFYDGLLFHRIIDDFVIQTGDPNTRDNNPYNDGSGGSSRTIPLEIHPELTHVDGAVGMARGAELDSATSQFYICDGDQHQLDGDYAVFWVTIDGIEAVRQIAQVETWGNKRPLLKDHPIEDVFMYSVFITDNNSGLSYAPPVEEDNWFFDDSFSVPGFDSAIVLCSIVIIILILGKKRNSKK
jgi:cyclophilin family peptidyl-prolyl cis-trans isomerase